VSSVTSPSLASIRWESERRSVRGVLVVVGLVVVVVVVVPNRVYTKTNDCVGCNKFLFNHIRVKLVYIESFK